ncbi:MAG: aldo/keto reductase, partial [Sphingomicrobium sp.]
NWYNLVERRKYEGELQDVAVARGLAVFPYYGLANGYLTGKYRTKDDLGKSPRGLRTIEYLEGRGPRVLAAIAEVASDTGAAMAAVALAWLKAQPGITAPIASATSVEQARDLIGALTFDLTAGQVQLLNEASA